MCESGGRDQCPDYRLCSPAASNQGFSLKLSTLERGADGKFESLFRLRQMEVRRQRGNCRLVAEITCPTRRAPAACDLAARLHQGVHPQRIVRVVNPERMLHNQQQHWKLKP